MTILYVFEIFYPEINGVNTSTIDLAKNLFQLGHKIIFLVPSSQGTPKTLLEDRILVIQVPSFPTYLYPNLKCCSPFSRVADAVIQKYHVDLVHITGPFSLAWRAIQAAKKKRLPVVHTFHTMLFSDDYIKHLVLFSFLIRLFKGLLLSYAKYFLNKDIFVTVPCQKTKHLLENLYPEVTAQVIPNGIDVEWLYRFQSLKDWKAQYPYWMEKTFLFVGRSSAEKSIDVLLKGFALACQKDPQIKLIIIGNGPDHLKLKTMALCLEMDQNVFFTGALVHEQVIQQGFFHHTLAFVTASISETHSMTASEALCCGLPIIAADDISNRDTIQDAGCYFPPGDYKSLAKVVIQWAQKDSSYQRCRAEALKQRYRFDGRLIARQFETLYQKLIDHRS